VTGQRAAENAVRSADDAFGTSISRETIGLYNSGNVGGFSPTAAGKIYASGEGHRKAMMGSSSLSRHLA